MDHAREFAPHAVCWLWNSDLILLHAIGSLLTAIAYFTIPAVVFYIYKRGELQEVATAYPQLWILGGLFVFLCGLSHLGSFIEIWVGGLTYWITGINNIAMAIASMSFAWFLWKKSEEIILIGKALRMFMDKED